MLITILATIVVLGVLIFVHELGHFLTAKLVDIEVPRFSIGFGPKVIGFRRGETEYVISLLPLGGYVKMAGMEEMETIEGGADQPEEPEPAAPATSGGATPGAATPAPTAATASDEPRIPRPRDFDAKSLPARALVISAGVIMNMLFAWLTYSVIASAWGVPTDPGPFIGGVTEERLPTGAAPLATIPVDAQVVRVNDQDVTSWDELGFALAIAAAGTTTLSFANAEPVTFELPAQDSLRTMLIFALEPRNDAPAVLGTIVPDDPADRAGLRPNDRVVEAAGQPVTRWQEFVAAIETRPGQPVPLTVERDGERLTITVTPRDSTTSGVRYGRIGVQIPAVVADLLAPRERVSPGAAIVHGGAQTWLMARRTIEFLGAMFTGEQSARQVGGPIMIGRMSGQFARAGLQAFLSFMAILSINLAILNLLPIPVLDGGHLVFLGIEAIRGRPLSLEQRMRFTQVGFIIIIGIMVWAIGNDVLSLFGI